MKKSTALRLVIIPLRDLELTDLYSSSSPSDPSSPPYSDPETPSLPAMPEIHPQFSTVPADVNGYASPLPASIVQFSFPATDHERVQAWLTGDFSHVVQPESDTLKKNMTSAVISTLKRFLAAARSQSLLASPFRISWRYRLFDGSATAPADSASEIISPLPRAPYMIITGNHLYETSLQTNIVFSATPARLMCKIPIPLVDESYRDIITAVEICISCQRDILSKDATVAGLRSVTIDGIRQRVWQYESYPEDYLVDAARGDSDMRIVASIPFDKILAGEYSDAVPIPLEAGIFDRFSSLPKAQAENAKPGEGSGEGVNGIDSWKPFLHASTPALDLNRPELRKTVASVYLNGVFQRQEMKLSLYGSHRREEWHLLAKVRGGAIPSLCRVPFRWLKVEFEVPMRRDDFIDSIIFSFS